MIDTNGINILHIVKGIDIGGKSGGAENFGIRLARALKKRDIRVSLCAYLQYGTSDEQYWFDRLKKDGIEAFYACSDDKVNIIKATDKINSWLKAHNIQYVHSHYQVGTITCLLLKLTGRCNYVLRTAHANLEFGRSISGSISRIVFRNFLYPLLVDYEIGVSDSITQSLNRQSVRRLIHKPAHWIPNAIPEVNENEDIDDPLADYLAGKSETPWLVTTIGILLPSKNLDLLVNAMHHVIKQVPQARLVVVGDGPEYRRLVDFSKQLGIQSSCWFLGQQRNIRSILKRSSVFVLPSSSEGASTALLEAIQNKVPIIASNIPGNRELIQDELSGWLFPVGDVDALSCAIIRAYQEPLKTKSMAEAAYSHIRPYYLSSVCDKYIEVYSSMIKKDNA